MDIPVNNEFAMSPHGLMVFVLFRYATWHVVFSTEFGWYYKEKCEGIVSIRGNQHDYYHSFHDTAISYFAIQLIGVSAADVSSMILVEVFQFVVDVQRSRDGFIEGEVDLFEDIISIQAVSSQHSNVKLEANTIVT